VSGRFDYLFVESTGILDPLPLAASRRGRRTALTFPLFPPPQAHHLACCREAPGRGRTLPGDAGMAWRQGVGFGLHCGNSCANLTAILLVIGVMDLRAMVVTAAITLERLPPAGERVAQAIGAFIVAAGLVLIARATGLG